MNVIQSAAAAATTFLPLDQGRALLVVPVRLVREGAVAVARTTRHWELVLTGAADHAVDLRDAAPSPGDGVVPGMPSSGTDELAVDDWAELSLADAQARITGLGGDDLRALLDYERAHGHRPQYTLLLERRLEQHSA